MNRTAIASLVLVIILAVFARVFPHVPNIAPITALALYSGAYLGRRFALVIPLLIMLISDVFLGFHNTMVFVYGSFVLISLVGIILGSQRTLKNTILATFVSSILFFLVTNFGVWLEGRMYAMTFQGLIECFMMALPFFRNTLVGDFFYVGLFFSAHMFVNLLVMRKGEVRA